MTRDDRLRGTQICRYDCLVFDLDDTLYPTTSGLAEECKKNIQSYMLEKLGINESDIPVLCNQLYKYYGTTMAGLEAIGYDFDYDNYHSYVHGRLPYSNLKPDPVLRNLLLSLPLRKVIFTNADKVHAAKVLSRLGLEDCFEGIVCFETLNPSQKMHNSPSNSKSTTKIFDILNHLSQSNNYSDLPVTSIRCKPSEDAIVEALAVAKIIPDRAIFFDDSIRNIQAGKRVGLHTVLVGTSHRDHGADLTLESIHNIREALPELWQDGKKRRSANYSGKIALETSVIA